ncbi:ABC transporter permease [Aeromicrobium piscarium]|uniref:ABC transporter permease n=1 Tax=Aeromicrobium piscarium TaxID=2590901 RepID=A0A554SD79_9ACTN|nr:ABC transporter permease [Aeromicrobium piscarium]TSD64282.1 ABC transporter permease [Aeromicrobium piscarium]
MRRFILMRVLRAVATIWAAVTITFLMLRLLPGDPAELIAGEGASEALIENLRSSYGLDRPLLTQYVDFLGGLLQGDFGMSYVQNVEVASLIVDRLPWTLLLTGSAFILTILVGIPLGTMAAVRRDGFLDRGLKSFGIASSALFVPSVAVLLLIVFAADLGWFAIGSTQDPNASGLAWLGSVANRLVLPVLTLVIINVGPYALTLRTNMVDVLQQEHVRAARARGIAERRIIWRYALRNGMLPALALMGLQLGALAGGSVLTETVFAYPGIGQLTHAAVMQRDYPVLQAAFVALAASVVLANLLTDVMSRVLDPRVTT